MKLTFEEELNRRRKALRRYLRKDPLWWRFGKTLLGQAGGWYWKKPGKALRPALVFFSCGAVGGEEEMALPAAAAVEAFHTWTLVHDDWIDRDKVRRGIATVHEEFARKWEKPFHLDKEDAQHFGGTVAMLAGDLLHGWVNPLLARLFTQNGLPPEIPLALIQTLERETLWNLLNGEMKDVYYSYLPVEKVSLSQIRSMFWQKTSALFAFCGLAGALIGLKTANHEHPWVEKLQSFARLCGFAFQLQDDILGIVGDEKTLGKPVGSDIREGKKTLPLRYAYQNATSAQKKFFSSMVRNRNATQKDVQSTLFLIQELKGVEQTRREAERHIDRGLKALQPLPSSRYKDLLTAWANYLLSRPL